MDRIVPHIILASGSPRRLEILRAHSIEPVVVLPEQGEDEYIPSCSDSKSPEELTCQLALCKARDVYRQVCSSSLPAHAKNQSSNTSILAADTIVYSEDVGILGKPSSYANAVWMLQVLCDTIHRVITSVALIDLATGEERSFTDSTTVQFGSYTLQDIEDYIAAEPPFDKAGSYAIQGIWGMHVVSIEGDLENVIGLPFYKLLEVLHERLG